MTIAETPICRHCGRFTDLILDDGPVMVCASCLRTLGQLAGDPTDADAQTLAALTERHGDVVRLVHTASRPSRLAWQWTDDWPKTGALT